MPEQYLNVLDPHILRPPLTSHKKHLHPVTNVSNSTNVQKEDCQEEDGDWKEENKLQCQYET